MYSVYNLKVSESKLATQINNIPISQQPDSFVMVYSFQGKSQHQDIDLRHCTFLIIINAVPPVNPFILTVRVAFSLNSLC